MRLTISSIKFLKKFYQSSIAFLPPIVDSKNFNLTVGSIKESNRNFDASKNYTWIKKYKG